MFSTWAVITLQKWFPTGKSTERLQSLKFATFYTPLKFFSDLSKEWFGLLSDPQELQYSRLTLI